MGVCKSKNKLEQPEIILKTTTWQRDSHGLFDYEGKEIDKKQYKGIGSFSIMRHDNQLELKYDNDSEKLEESKEDDSQFAQIAKILEKNGSYWIYHNSTVEDLEDEVEKNPETKLWRVVKFCKSRRHNINGYKVMPDDLIKLGRVRFKVREIQSNAYRKLQARQQNKQKKYLTTQTRNSVIRSGIRKNSNDITDTDQNQLELQNQESANIVPFAMSQPETPNMVIVPQQFKDPENATPLQIRDPSFGTSSGTPLCRICLSEENDSINPLFSPCKCAGTMKFIHLQCLQEWLNSRKITKETACTKTFYWKNLECELCKTTYPNQVRTGENKNVFLRVIKYELPSYMPGEDPQYIVLESISTNTSKVIHVVNMLKSEEVKIGRGHDVDVRVTDISVSRVHALIKKSPKGYFYLEDNHSKFGSLVLIRNPAKLKDGDPNIIQAGRTLMEISIKRPIKIFNSCICNQAEKNGNTNRSSSQAKRGLVSKNGFDFFPEEFLPVLGKTTKLGKRLQSDSSRIKQGQGPIITGFQSDINIEEAIVRDRQQINSVPYNGAEEADDEQIDPMNDENNQGVQNRSAQLRSRSLIQIENNDEENKDATNTNHIVQELNAETNSQNQNNQRFKKNANLPKQKRGSRFSKGSRRSNSKHQNSEEEKNDNEAVYSQHFSSTQQQLLNKSTHRLRRTIDHRNSNGSRIYDDKQGDVIIIPRNNHYLQSNDEIPIDTIQLQGNEYATVAAQPHNLDNLDFDEQPIIDIHSNEEFKQALEEKQREIEEEDRLKEEMIFQKVQRQIQEVEDDDNEMSSHFATPVLYNKQQQIKNNKQFISQNQYFEEDDQKLNIFSRDMGLKAAGNSNLPTGRLRESNEGLLVSNRLKQGKNSHQSQNRKHKDELTYLDESEKNSDFIHVPTLPTHQIISQDNQMEINRVDKIKSNKVNNLFNSELESDQRQSQQSNQLSSKDHKKEITNVIRIQSDAGNYVQQATFENNLIKKQYQPVEDDLVVSNLRSSFEEIKISQTQSKKKLINMNKSFENQRSQEIFAKKESKDQLNVYNQHSKELKIGKQGSEGIHKRGLDFYQSLSNFIPLDENNQQSQNDDDHNNQSQ